MTREKKKKNGITQLVSSVLSKNDRGPVLSAIVVIDDPQGDGYTGGAVAAPIFAELAGYSVRQLHLAPFGDGTVVEQRIRSEPAVAQLTIESQATPESVQ